MSYKWPIVFMVIVAAAFSRIAPTGRAAQSGSDKSHFLIARREMPDPLFKESVVLMLPSKDTDVVVGLIVNKATRVLLHEVFPKNPALMSRSDIVYFGGPVDIETPGALFLTSKPSPQAIHLIGDLFVSFDSDFIQGILEKPKEVRDVRLFLGRAQWLPEQLQAEMQRGAWYSVREENSWIFSPKPEIVWPTLIARAEPGTIARLNSRHPQLTLDEFTDARPSN